MLRIKTIEDAKTGITVHLCGQFTAEYVGELEAAIGGEGQTGRKIRLDLSGVTFVDRPAMEFLCSATRRQMTVENLPSYVRRWIEQERNCGPTSHDSDPPPCPES